MGIVYRNVLEHNRQILGELGNSIIGKVKSKMYQCLSTRSAHTFSMNAQEEIWVSWYLFKKGVPNPHILTFLTPFHFTLLIYTSATLPEQCSGMLHLPRTKELSIIIATLCFK